MPKLIDAKGINSIDSKRDDEQEEQGGMDEDADSEDADSDSEGVNHNDNEGGVMGDASNSSNQTLQLKWLVKPTTFTSDEEIKSYVYEKPDDLNRWSE